jgi:hypothetical protein
MKLTKLLNTNTHAEYLAETGPRHSKAKDEIVRPLGISIEEFTPEYKHELELVRDNDPHLWHKIKNGL